MQSEDVGRITSYAIKLNDKAYHVPANQTRCTFLKLKPYTKYKLQMKAISIVGEGLWSEVKTVTTQIASKALLTSVYTQGEYIPLSALQ